MSFHYVIERPTDPRFSQQWEWVEDIYTADIEVAKRRFDDCRKTTTDRLRLVAVIEEAH